MIWMTITRNLKSLTNKDYTSEEQLFLRLIHTDIVYGPPRTEHLIPTTDT